MSQNSKLTRAYNHPIVEYGVKSAMPPIVGYTGVGWLAAEGIQKLGKAIDQGLPVALRNFQTIDNKVGKAIVETGGKPAKVAISVDKGIKDLWGRVLDIDEEQRQQNRETLGLSEPIYLKGETIQQSTQPAEFHYFEQKAQQISDPLVTIALGFGLVKGAYNMLKKAIIKRKFNKSVSRVVNRILDERGV